MTSDELKYAVMHYFRFYRQALYIATEVGGYSQNIRDILCVVNGKVIEIETKISLSDLRADFKKEKWHLYSLNLGKPNRFYYAVPDELEEAALKILDGKPYGLIVIKQKYNYEKNRTKIAKKAQELYSDADFLETTQEELTKQAEEMIFKRMASDIINCHRKLIRRAKNA